MSIEAVYAPSPEAFKVTLDGILVILIWCLAALPVAGGLELGALLSPLRPKLYCGPVISRLHCLSSTTTQTGEVLLPVLVCVSFLLRVMRRGFQIWLLLLSWSNFLR